MLLRQPCHHQLQKARSLTRARHRWFRRSKSPRKEQTPPVRTGADESAIPEDLARLGRRSPYPAYLGPTSTGNASRSGCLFSPDRTIKESPKPSKISTPKIEQSGI